MCQNYETCLAVDNAIAIIKQLTSLGHPVYVYYHLDVRRTRLSTVGDRPFPVTAARKGKR